MRAIQTHAIFTGFRSRTDGSIGFSGVTPELKPAEKTVFFELQNLNTTLLITPMDEPELEVEQVEAEFEGKTCSQRLRAVLFVLWKQGDDKRDFEIVYKERMNAIIEKIKEKLKPL